NSVEQVIYIAGEQVRVELTSPQGTQTTIYHGKRGWLITPKETHPLTDDDRGNLRGRVLSVLKIDALPEFTAATNKGAEDIRGHHTWAVELTTGENKTETAFFDQQTG